MAADYGFVYCIWNEYMPGIFKIGKTSRSVLLRAQELSSSTSIPSEFEVLFYVETDEMSALERGLHEDYDDSRISSNREFFNANIEDIWISFDVYAYEAYPITITPRGKELLAVAEFERKARENLPPREYAFEKWIAQEKKAAEPSSEIDW